MSTRPGIRAPHRWGLGVAAAAALLTLGGCAGGGDGDGAADRAAPAAAEAGAPDNAGTGSDLASLRTTRELRDAPTVAVISTGTVSLESADVAKARFDVQKIVDVHHGTISQSETSTGDDGKPETARLVLRIPSADFSQVMRELEDVAELQSSTEGSEDVTAQVIDTEARVRAQEKSLRQFEALLVRADTLQEIIALENQISRRQADLDALKATQAYLEDQTTLSTITVHLERTTEPQKDDGDAGFLSGLERGWDGLVATTVGLVTLLGLLLPFALVIALLGVPLWLVLRTQRRRRPAAPADPEPLA
jgi:hypothetical protein